MADIATRSPFQELTDRLNHLFDQAWLHSTVPSALEEGTLAVDVSEDEHSVTVRASLPGFDESEIDVQLEAGVLSITARHAQSHEEQSDRYYRRERFVGAVSRRIALPGAVADAEVQAALDKGVLTIRVPRAESAKPKKIAIKSPAA